MFGWFKKKPKYTAGYKFETRLDTSKIENYVKESGLDALNLAVTLSQDAVGDRLAKKSKEELNQLVVQVDPFSHASYVVKLIDNLDSKTNPVQIKVASQFYALFAGRTFVTADDIHEVLASTTNTNLHEVISLSETIDFF